MDQAKPRGIFGMIFGGLWAAFNGVRRFVFGVIAIMMLFGVLASLGGDTKALNDKTALIIPLKGMLVEQFSGSAQDTAIAAALGEESNELRIRDVRAALALAAKDPKIERVLLRVEADFGAGQVGLREVVDALQKFKKDSGKEIIAYGYNYAQRGLFVAAAADKVYMHPEGLALIEGLGRSRTYYKSALDKLGVKVNVFRVGTFKSAVEPYLLDGPSEAATEADLFWLGDLWTRFLDDYAAMRKIKADDIRTMIDQLPQQLAAVGGNPAKLALQAKLIDELKTPDEIREMMLKKGARDSDLQDPNRVDYRKVMLKDYLSIHADQIKSDAAKANIAIIVAEGGISDGSQPQGQIGGDSTAALIRKARENKDIKAIVLRVNSPGGSGFASEVIRREMEITKAAGKTVYVSMGDIAASGGYWISMASDGVFAHPSTITGSIGIYGLLPSAKEGLNSIGIHSGGASTTWIATAGDPAQDLDPRLMETMQMMINHGYQDFITKVGSARKKTPEQIDMVAQGRVWSGLQAKGHGLVDSMGLLGDAVAAAAKKAGLSNTNVRYIEEEPEGFAAFLQSFKTHAVISMGEAMEDRTFAANLLTTQAREQVRSDMAMFVNARENPFQTYAHCLCDIR